jgi:dTDP-4-dehydrorhamnose reductase
MLRLMSERNEISVVSDQIGTPTYALDLARTIITIIDAENWKPGIYHYSSLGKISWYDFAVAIAAISKSDCKVNAVTSDQFPTEASRPNYSLLDKTKITSTFGIKVTEWEDSLEECIKILNQKK